MDKKSTIFGVLCLVGAVLLMIYQGREASRRAASAPPPAPVVAGSQVASTTEAPAVAAAASEGASVFPQAAAELAPVVEQPEQLVVLENDLVRVTLTTRGGAVRGVELKAYPAVQGEEGHYQIGGGVLRPALALYQDLPGRAEEWLRGDWEVVSQAPGSVEFRWTGPGGAEIRRSYSLGTDTEGATPYLLRGALRFVNAGVAPLELGRMLVDVGTAAPTGQEGTTAGYDAYGEFLNFGVFDGEDATFHSVNQFRASRGFLGMGARAARPELSGPDRVVWSSVKNQFFATILTFSEPVDGWVSRLVEFPEGRQGITGLVGLDLGVLTPSGERRLDFTWYAGPKEYPRLSKLDARQDEVMQFGWVAWISKILLHFLLFLQGLVGNYGVAIILMVVAIRVALWPLTAQAARAAKRMATIQKPLQELREKFKDQPEKLQKETMRLFQEHKVNPVAGCFPILIQIPIFFALFGMLRTASELRFADFLWAADLSRPDTIAEIAGIPLNPLPLMMGVSMFVQMKMTPSTMDKLQQRIMLAMPLLVTFMCYGFSSGLALYWTISNLFSILQQYLTNRSADPVPATAAAAVAPVSKKKRKG